MPMFHDQYVVYVAYQRLLGDRTLGPRLLKHDPSVVSLPRVAHNTDGKRSKSVLSPFRDGATKPVFEKYGTVPDMLAMSHASDAGLATAPRRLSIRGTFFSDLYPELLLGVWEKYVAFTEGNEDVKVSAVLWDLTSPAKLAEVDVDATALKTRESHYWMAVQSRSTTDAFVAAVREITASTVAYVCEKNAQLSCRGLGWFVNLCAGDEKVEDVFGRHLPRLREAKRNYDPEQIWKKGVFADV
ncbi:unnamed protein product [Peniophora sp. CBMAI 1063]|nr:unnamed protein product [Peniophora sp. CBMAI 1063]